MQPPYLPREDVAALGLAYRRIPILSIGRDVYFDTRLILRKLEELFPTNRMGGGSPEQRGVEQLLEKWTVDGGIFGRAGMLVPQDIPLVQEERYVKDREDLMGIKIEPAMVKRAMPEAVAEIRESFEYLETTFLADGRQWILHTEKPTLADVNGEKDKDPVRCATSY